jgi:hypothetical protein
MKGVQPRKTLDFIGFSVFASGGAYQRAIIYPDLSIPFISKREGNGTGSYVFPLATFGQDYIPRNILVSECGDASCF